MDITIHASFLPQELDRLERIPPLICDEVAAALYR
jgi:hypothetical protein